MFKNYAILALRNIWKNKLFAAINIAGLAIGLAVFMLAQIVARYELSHDSFFPEVERIFAIYSNVRPEADMMTNSLNVVQSRVQPLMAEEVPAAEYAARLLAREFLASTGERKFNQPIRFADPEFLRIFQFEYLLGDASSALTDPSSLVLTESVAQKYFGTLDPIGQVITFRNQYDLRVSAVIRELPRNSHFNSSVVGQDIFEMVASLEALSAMSDFDSAGDWDNLSTNDKTYVLLSETCRVDVANAQLEQLFQTHMPDEQKKLLSGFELRPVADINTWIWEATGFPVISSIQILGLLILVIACLNYVNLATAQLLTRTREVGMRKTLGASRVQLFTQFISESILLTAVALVIAIVLIKLAIPAINEVSFKDLSFDLTASVSAMPSLVIVTFGVGVLAGSYPAYLVASGKIVGMLNGELLHGQKGGKLRNIMLVAQFSISIFMMIAVAIVFAQNQKVAEGSQIFAKDQIIVLARISRPEIMSVIEPLRNELRRVPGVTGVAFSSQVPFEQNHSAQGYSVIPGDESAEIELYVIRIDEHFVDLYDMPALAGRGLSADQAADALVVDEEGMPLQQSVNVLVNESAARRLGHADFSAAVGKNFYRLDPDTRFLEHRIVGVVPDNNFLGLFNDIKPIMFVKQADRYRLASVRIAGGMIPQTLEEIDNAWQRVIVDYPIQRRFLAEFFDDIFQILEGINTALSIFAALALLVALIGLFGLTAFMAEQRTKEVGIRKVMGATVPRIVKLLVWHFLRPVLIAILLASPLAWLAAGAYLNFFSERVSLSPMFFVSADLVAIVVAALTTSVHAIKAARARPVNALRYE